MDKNEFITLNAYFTGGQRNLNINHIICYYTYDDRTVIELDNGNSLDVMQTCEQVKKLINEVISK